MQKFCNGDSTGVEIRQKLLMNTSASMSTFSNWRGLDGSSVTLSGETDLWISRRSSNRSQFHSFHLDLAYTKLVDSLWMKSSDRIRLSMQFRRKKRMVSNSYSVLFRSQLMNGYRYASDGIRPKRQLYEKGLIPFRLEIGYGIAWKFWKMSSLNISAATVRIIGSMRKYGSGGNGDSIIRTNSMLLSLDYGFSAQWYILEDLSDGIEWINDGRFYLDDLNSEGISGELRNKFIIRIWKFLKLVIETRSRYDPYYSSRLQFSNMVLLGWFYTSDNSSVKKRLSQK